VNDCDEEDDVDPMTRGALAVLESDEEEDSSLLLLSSLLLFPLPLSEGLPGLEDRDLFVTGLRGLGRGVVVVVVVVVLGTVARLLVSILFVDLSLPAKRFRFLDPNGLLGVDASDSVELEVAMLEEVATLVDSVVREVGEGVEANVVIG
jgi:hypothetical protein